MNKNIIGMIHLKALPGSPANELTNDEIFNFALLDLKALEKGGIKEAIVENMFDSPLSTVIIMEQIISFVYIFSRLKEYANISLGVNIQYADDDLEMKVATLCGADFIRVEAFIEDRVGSFGRLHPSANIIMKAKKELKSNVIIYTDINVKHTIGIVDYDIRECIHEAIRFGSNGIILTGIGTGKAPTVEDAAEWEKYCNNTKLFIGSGIEKGNIKDFLQFADGVIVGSSIKKEGNIENPIDYSRVKELIDEVK